MPSTTPIEPRKRPSQKRSEATVAALLDATEAELLASGYDRMSTNKVAKRAGVSIGSLYQYFPGKEALVVALRKRLAEQERRMVAGKLAELEGAGLADVAREIVRTLAEMHRSNPGLHKAFATEVPAVAGLEHSWESDRLIADLLLQYLAQRSDEVTVPDLRMATFIVLHAVEGLIDRALLQQPHYLGSSDFVDEVTRFVVGYLQAPRPASKYASRHPEGRTHAKGHP